MIAASVITQVSFLCLIALSFICVDVFGLTFSSRTQPGQVKSVDMLGGPFEESKALYCFAIFQ